jgi:GT2 family glycosyltransferase
VAYQSGPVLGRCLAALRCQTFADFEVLLVDNGSTDGAALAAAQADPLIRFLPSEENLGFAAGNNRAADVAMGAWLALLNPDAFPEPEWLEQLLAAARRHPDVNCFASLQLDAADPLRMDGAGDVMTSAGIPYRGGYGLAARRVREGEVFSACGAAMLIRRETFQTLGGFDARFFCYCEDVDLGYRLRLSGERTILVPKARVAHVGSSTLGVRSRFAVFHGSRNRVWTFVKNTPPVLFWLSLPLHIGVTAGLTLLSLKRGLALTTLRGIIAALRDLAPVLAQRRALQAHRRVGSLAILRVMALDPIAFFGRRIVVR